MSDSKFVVGHGAFGPEPERDARLSAALRTVVGDVPTHSVDWNSLARRIAHAVAIQRPSPWWSWAARWERRVVSLALVAGIGGAVALWSSTAATRAGETAALPDLVTSVAGGTPASDAATTFAHSLTRPIYPVTGVVE